MLTSDAFMIGMVGVLAACTYALGPWMMFKLYMVPYWINVVWLDVVTYLHHHGSSDPNEKVRFMCGVLKYDSHGILPDSLVPWGGVELLAWRPEHY